VFKRNIGEFGKYPRGLEDLDYLQNNGVIRGVKGVKVLRKSQLVKF